MHNIHSSNKKVAVSRVEAIGFAIGSLVPGVKVLGLGAIARTVSILATVIDEEVARTETSFLTFGVVET